jgi:hypothetical protein
MSHSNEGDELLNPEQRLEELLLQIACRALGEALSETEDSKPEDSKPKEELAE